MLVGMDDTIKLDRRSFEALAADSRVRVLKAISKRRKTLTELSKELGLSVSTTKEHLDVLVDAGLIIQKDEGRKWKYYELSRKGKGIVNPYPAKFVIMLAVSLLLVLGSGWNFMNSFGDVTQGDAAPPGSFAVEGESPEEAALPGEGRVLAIAEDETGDMETEKAPSGGRDAAEENEVPAFPAEEIGFPLFEFGIFAGSAVLLFASLRMLLQRS
ncbi:ArsR family transcriptional regulator [Candidatus Micrarchaeota archaeon]|nr:ArsR family transcriptional regulator [Candidatus Micrarchaeota archaeon]MBD3418355.1 ArsR family transcriptional regulator [Candidatus Micrarchaeota archaeon]